MRPSTPSPSCADQANDDLLTALPNREGVTRRLTIALEIDQALAVAFIDIDDFKVINDSLGHGAGDRLLVAVAESPAGAAAHRPIGALRGEVHGAARARR